MAGADFWAGFAGGLAPHIQNVTSQIYAQRQAQDAQEQQLIEFLSRAEDPDLRTLAVAAQMDRAQGRSGKGVLSGLKLKDLVSGRFRELPVYKKLGPIVSQLEGQMQGPAPAGAAGAGPGEGAAAGAAGAAVGVPPPSAPIQPAPSSGPAPENTFLSVLSDNAKPALPLAQFAGQPQLAPQVAQGSALMPQGTSAQPPAAPAAEAVGAPPPGPEPSPIADVEGMGFRRDVLGNFGPLGQHAVTTTLAGRVSEKERFRAEEAAKRAEAAEKSRRDLALEKFEREQAGRIEAIELKATRAMERVKESGRLAKDRKGMRGETKPSGITERDRQLRLLAIGQDERDDVLKLEVERDKELREIERDRMLAPSDRPAMAAATERAWNAKIAQTRKAYADARAALHGTAVGGGAGSAPPARAGAGLNPPGSYVGELKVFPNGRQAWWDGQIWSPTPPGGGLGVLAPEVLGAPPP